MGKTGTVAAGSEDNGTTASTTNEEDEPLIDPDVLERLKFSQIGGRRNWEGVSVQHAGIPGNVSLNINERQLMF